MKIIRNMIVALSMYSRIPMPVFAWKEEDTKYAIAFLSLVGIIIGAVEYGILQLETLLQIPVFVKTFLWAAIPLFITGGFHVDGFMDVQDALKSYKPAEEKLKILKDPHIGAFSVISLSLYGCIFLAASYLLLYTDNTKEIVLACMGFTLIRAIGAYLSLVLRHAKDNGMLHEETKRSGTATKIILVVTIVLCLGIMAYFDSIAMLILAVVLLLYIIWFRNKCYREFGGIGGDAIGYFITESELLVVICVAVIAWINI